MKFYVKLNAIRMGFTVAMSVYTFESVFDPNNFKDKEFIDVLYQGGYFTANNIFNNVLHTFRNDPSKYLIQEEGGTLHGRYAIVECISKLEQFFIPEGG